MKPNEYCVVVQQYINDRWVEICEGTPESRENCMKTLRTIEDTNTEVMILPFGVEIYTIKLNIPTKFHIRMVYNEA